MTRDQGKTPPPDHRLTAEVAVRWGHVVVTLPVLGIMLGLWGLAGARLRHGGQLSQLSPGLQIALAVAVVIGPPATAWLWWAYAVPRWRHWALSRGADPKVLQDLAQAQGLVWPKGSFFERTEFRYTPKQ
jgi:hypothetical protein